MVNNWKKMVNNWKGFWISLFCGQLLSILVASIGFTSSQLAKQLAKKGIEAPYSPYLLFYLLLTFCYGSVMYVDPRPLKAQPFQHIWVTTVDVLAKFFVMQAYRYTSLTSVMLLDCWTIPCVVLFTWCFFKTKCGPGKLAGIILCVLGLATVVLSDILQSADIDTFAESVAGDVAIIIGATLYALFSVCEGNCLKNADRVEIMTFLGLFGVIIVAFQIAVKERNEFKSILSSPETLFPLIGFTVAMFLFYVTVPLLCKTSGSKMLTLTLLTSNMLAVLIRIFVYHEKVNWIYFAGFAAVALGLFIYSWRDDMDPNKAVRIDEEALLVRSDNDNDGSGISFVGARNSLCYISS